MKDYYKILGLGRNASYAEIKKEYRKLALTHHPDRNTAKDAHARFIEINEAYQILSEPQKRLKYNYLYDRYILGLSIAPVVQPTTSGKQTRPVANIKYRGAPYSRSRRYAKKETYQMPAWSIRLANYFCTISLIFVFMLAIDYFLPLRNFKEAADNSYSRTIRGTGTYYIQTPNFTIPANELVSLNDTMLISVTPVLKIVKEYKNISAQPNVIYKPAYSIYSHFIFLPLILFISSTAGIIQRKQGDSAIKAAIPCFLILIIILAVL